MSYENSCIHYRGLQQPTCKAGIFMEQLDPTPEKGHGLAWRLPCIKTNTGTVGTCDKCHYPTPEEIAAHEADLELYFARRHEDGILLNTWHSRPEDADKVETTVFVCQLCQRASRFVTDDGSTLVKHIADSHELVNPPVKQSLIAHMYAADWHQVDLSWTRGPLEVAIKSVRTKRNFQMVPRPAVERLASQPSNTPSVKRSPRQDR